MENKLDYKAEEDSLKKLFPLAAIKTTVTPNHIEYNCDFGGSKYITEKQDDALFKLIKEMFGDRLMERYSYHTGHFSIYVKH